MKRLLLTLSCILAVASFSYAGGIPSTTVGGKTFTFKQSNNVGITYFVDSTTSAQNYVADTKNTAGNRIYSSSNMTSNVWYKESDAYKGKTLSDVSGDTMTNPGESTYSGWSSQ